MEENKNGSKISLGSKRSYISSCKSLSRPSWQEGSLSKKHSLVQYVYDKYSVMSIQSERNSDIYEQLLECSPSQPKVYQYMPIRRSDVQQNIIKHTCTCYRQCDGKQCICYNTLWQICLKNHCCIGCINMKNKRLKEYQQRNKQIELVEKNRSNQRNNYIIYKEGRGTDGQIKRNQCKNQKNDISMKIQSNKQTNLKVNVITKNQNKNKIPNSNPISYSPNNLLPPLPTRTIHLRSAIPPPSQPIQPIINDEGYKTCTCKKTKCLKAYCSCYANGIHCSKYCQCEKCQNKVIINQMDIQVYTQQQYAKVQMNQKMEFQPFQY